MVSVQVQNGTNRDEDVAPVPSAVATSGERGVLFCFLGRVLPLFLSMCFTLDVRKREIKAVDMK